MEISNIKNFARLRKNNVLLNIFFLGLIITFATIENFKEFKTYIIIGITIVYILTLIYFILLKFTYVVFKDLGNKILIKHYTLSPIGRKYVGFEILKSSFSGFEIKDAFLNKRQDLHIKVRLNNKTATYPPISLSAFKQTEKDNLLDYLKKINVSI